MRRRHLLPGSILALSLLGACDDHRSARPDTRTSSRPTPTASRDAGPSSLWPAEVEPLDAPTRDASREACLARHRTALTTGVAEAISDLGYDAFFEDVCAAEHAIRARDAAACASILATPLRTRCVARVAVLAGAPDACPSDATGRDPLCLAFATGELALCDTAPARDRVRCRAALEGDTRRCRSADDVAFCEATVARYASTVAERRTTHATHAEASLVARHTATGEETALVVPDPRRGVRLAGEACAHALTLEATTERFGTRPALIALGLTIPVDVRLPLRLAAADVTLRARVGTHTFDTLLGSSGMVTLTRFEARRLGPLALTVDVTLRDGDERVRVTGTITTFVRDLDEPRCVPP